MESNSCETPRGEGVVTTNQIAPDTFVSQQCQHISPAGRHCRMLSADESGLCAYHALPRFAAPSLDPDGTASISEETAAELLGAIKDFRSPAAVNVFVGNLIKQVVRKRVTRRDAITLAYLSQLVLNSQSAMTREQAVAPKPRPHIVWDGIFAPDFGKQPPINETPTKEAPTKELQTKTPQTEAPQMEG